jgi:hypothetical protein
MSIRHEAFLDLEEAVSDMLNRTWARESSSLLQAVDHAVACNDFETAHRLVEQLDTIAVIEKNKKALETLSISSFFLGQSRLSNTRKLRLRDSDWLMIDRSMQQLGYMVGGNATDALRQAGHALLQKRGEEVQKLEDDRSYLRVKLTHKGKSYFALAASLQVSRLSAFGFLAKAVERGLEHYRIDAVLDDRTCPVCKELDGKVFPVEAGFAHANMILDVQNPSELQSIAPFYAQDKISVAQLKLYSTDDLIEQGLLLPPFHFLCRCILTKTDEVAQVHPSDATDRVAMAHAALFGHDDPVLMTQELFRITPDLPPATVPAVSELAQPAPAEPTELGGAIDQAVRAVVEPEGQPLPAPSRRVWASLLAWLGLGGLLSSQARGVTPDVEGVDEDEETEDPEG